MSTLASMHAEVKLGLMGRGDLESLIDDVLNQAQILFATRLRIRELEVVANATLNPNAVNPGPDIVAVPVDFWAPILLCNTSKQRTEIHNKPLDLLVMQMPTPAGDPSRYSLRAMTMLLRPQPKDADVIEFTYRFKPSTMTSLVDMTLPEEFRQPVVMHTLTHLMHLVAEEDRAKLFKDQRDDGLRLLGDQRGEEFISQIEGVRLQWSGLEGAFPTWR